MARNVSRIVIGMVLVGALALRLAPAGWIALHPERALFPDSWGYLALAEQIERGGPYRLESLPGMDFMRPPGYPLFLAGLGMSGLGEPWTVALIQLLMGAVVSVLVYRIANELGDKRSALVGGVLYYILPNAVVWAMAILTDTLFVLLIVLAAAAILRFCNKRQVRWAAIAGALVGAAALTRPVGVLLLPAWTLLLAVLEWRRRGAWRRLAAPALFAAVAAGVLLPWAERNRAEYGILAVSSIDIVNLREYMAPAALARAEGIGLEEARDRIGASGIPQPGDRARYLEVIAAYPLEYLAAHLEGTRVLLTEAGQPNLGHLLGERYRSAGVLVALRGGDLAGAARAFVEAMADPVERWFLIVPWFGMALQLVIYLLSTVGLLTLLKQGGSLRWAALFVLATILIFILSPGPVGNGRFRLPAEPFLCILAGIGASLCLRRGRHLMPAPM